MKAARNNSEAPGHTEEMRRTPTDQSEDLERQFEHLYEEYAPAVMAYALRRTTLQAAQDIVAETFVVAWRRMGEIPGDAVLPWLYGVAHKVDGNRVRTEARQQSLVNRIRTEPRITMTPESAPHSNLLAALASMPRHDREVLMLTAWEGLSTGEASLVLDCSPTAVRLRLYRARRRLRVRLDQIDAEDTLPRVPIRSWTKESL
jgi:RNA polymerase sigma-70 factor, ECF subfamily